MPPAPPPNDRQPYRPTDDVPTLAERIGCFVFVLFPLVFGIPVLRAWATVLGDWILYVYGGGCALMMGYIIYLLEKQD